MKLRSLPSIFAVFVLAATAFAQGPASAPPPQENSGPGNGGGYGQHGGHGMGMMGRGVMGTVTEVAADHYTIKTEMGEVYTVHFNADTRIVKMPADMRGPGGNGDGGQGMGRGYGHGNGGNPPQQIKASDIKVGDAIVAMGDNDATAKSVSATHIVQLDPDTVKHMQEMTANFGKTWLSGKVTAINQTTITLTGTLDKAAHTVVVDENTAFRRQRDPLTLADIQVGDNIGVLGAVNNGVFTATAVNVGGGMGGHPSNHPSGPPAAAPPSPAPSAPPQ